MKWILSTVITVSLGFPSGAGAQTTQTIGDFEPLVSRLQTLVETADRGGLLDLMTPDVDLGAAREFVEEGLRENVDRGVVLPRFLIPADDTTDTHELTVEVFTEVGDRARLQTWRLEVTGASPIGTDLDADPAASPPAEAAWRISGFESMGGLDTLHHLRLDRGRQFDATNLVVVGEDMTLRMTRGAAFVAEIDAGITGLVLIGDGEMTFEPALEAERRQVEIFSGRQALEAAFTHAFVRVNPSMLTTRVSPSMLEETPVDNGDLGEAQRLFDATAPLSYSVDLGDVSDRTWWLTPTVGHFQAEITTRRYGTLTFAEAQNQPEDISLSQRTPEYKIISLYPSARQRAIQGRYYDDQDIVPYDVLDYDIIASFEPAGVRQESLRARAQLEGCWIDGTARIAIRAGSVNFNSLTLQLADELHVRSVTSREYGPLMFFRMTGRDNIIVSLPTTIPIGTEFTVVVDYSGLLQAQESDENWLGRTRHLFDAETMFGVGEHRYIYSGATAWYPQAPIPDFATATMELTVPADYGVVASGDAAEGNPSLSALAEDSGPKSYRFTTLQPAKYLSAVISRFWAHDTPALEVALDTTADRPSIRSGVVYDRVALTVETNPRSRDRLGDYYARASDILGFYGSLVGDIPYPALTVTLTDSLLPGGHSPAYFAVMNQPLPLNPGLMWSWGDDPVAFDDVEDLFLAHEIAHQWWGQAVAWKNYHEQWLSEALAQYFAALYIKESLGDEVFQDVLAEMRQWSERYSDEGPVYLGYRLGHLQGDARVFRALVYNKGALVFHMLRRLIGDDAFYDGLRRYYSEMRFKRAGTDDLMKAFETAAARSLEQFFERWIHGAELPEIRFDYHTEARLSDQQGETDVVLQFEQVGPIFEVPVTVTLKYRSGEEESTVVPVTEQLTEVRLPLKGQLREATIAEDKAFLGEIRR